MTRLRLLDLFSGTGSITRAFRHHEVTSLDIDARCAPTICANLLDWQYKTLPRGHFDVIWASCPCEQYSVARSNARTPRDLMLSDSLVLRTQDVLDWFQPRCYFVENPSGSQLWSRFKWPRLVRTSYCTYGFPYRKHTTIATNTDISLRPPCGGTGVCAQMVGSQHLQHAQKGGKEWRIMGRFSIPPPSSTGSPRNCAVTCCCTVSALRQPRGRSGERERSGDSSRVHLSMHSAYYVRHL